MVINYSEIEKHISSARLNSYRSLNPSGTTEETVGLYYWNKVLCSTFYPALQCLEITLRNAIHTTASAHFNNGAWYDPLVRRVGDELYQRGQLGFNAARNRREKSISEKKIQEAKDKLTRAGKTITPPGVIAELSFGFWTNLLTAQYEDINLKRKLWPNLTPLVFPNTVGIERDIGFLNNKFKTINKIRNRLSHHEPLWKSGSSYNFTSALAYVRTEYSEIMDCIGYMSLDRKVFLENSYMGKEFNKIATIDGINEFINKADIKSTTMHKLRKDINLYLNRCDKGASVHFSRNNRDVYKITKI